MGDMKDKSIHRTAQKLTEEIQVMEEYKALYSNVEKIAASPCVQKGAFKETLLSALKTSGVEMELRNVVFHWMRSQKNCSNSTNGYPIKEPLAYLRKAQLQWEKRIHKSLNSMCAELGVPLARLRLASDRDELSDKWNELSTYDIDLISQYRPVYAPKDFLEVLLWIKSPNYRPVDGEGLWHFAQIPIRVKTLTELHSLYAEISRGEPLLGVNPHMPSASYPTLEAERTINGEKVIGANHAPVAQEFLKRGCPKCQRGKVWAQVLGSQVRQSYVQHFNQLKQLVLQYNLLVDKLIIKDVQLTASNDDQYFVFEDILYQVMLCFSRDTDVLSVFNHSASNPVHAVLKNKTPCVENTVIYPPSGIIPFHGFTMFAMPVCYLYENPVELYFTFRAFYLRYWFRLHEVSSHEQGILPLCLLFERLLQRHEPELWVHFRLVSVQPMVRVVFKWLMRAFSGHLPPEQLLYLWDAILAYDSLEILPVLAAAILSFRKDNLLQVDTLQSIEAVVADLSSIVVMPLIQMALLREN